MTVVTLLFLTGLFEDLPRRRSPPSSSPRSIELVDIRGAGRALPPLHAPARPHLRPRGPARLHRRGGRDVRRAGVRHAPGSVHRHRRVARCSCCTARRSRTSPSSGRCRARRTSSPTVDRHPENVDDAGRRRSCGSKAGCSSPTPTRSATQSGPTRPQPGTRAVVLDAETIPFVDVTAVTHARRARGRPRCDRTSSSSSPTTSGRCATCSARPAVRTARWRCTRPSGPRSTRWPSRDGDAERRRRVRAVARVDPALRPPVAREGPRRWARRRRGGDPAGDGVRDHRRPAGGGGALHVHAADGRLRAPRRLADPVGEHHVDHRRPHRVDARRRGHRRRCVGSRRRPRDAHHPGRRHPARGPAAPHRRADRQHLGGDARRDQDRGRSHRGRRSAPEVARHACDPSADTFFSEMRAVVEHLDDISVDHARVLGRERSRSCSASVGSRRVCPRRWSRWSGGIALVAFGSIDEHGVAVIAEVPSGLPDPGRAVVERRPAAAPGGLRHRDDGLPRDRLGGAEPSGGPRSRPSTTTRSCSPAGSPAWPAASSGRCRRRAASRRPPSTRARGPAPSSASW